MSILGLLNNLFLYLPLENEQDTQKMITPRFSCSQTKESVIVSIYCPSVRASEVEINVDETLLTVHINPYYLRLNFSSQLLEDDLSSAHYDPGSGHLTITLSKACPGEEFKDLDLLAQLLAPKLKDHSPTIEVISTEDDNDLVGCTTALSLEGLSSERREILEAANNDWQLPQNVPESLPLLNLSLERPYGFLDTHSGYFRHVSHTENEVNELGSDAETCPVEERRLRRLKHEEESWDEEHYMADFADDSCIQELVAWNNPHVTNAGNFQFTEEENRIMLQLPRKEYLMTNMQTHNLYLTLVTILFSYAYETRTTQHDPTPESAWTLGTLTPAFSALDSPPYAQVADASNFSTAELLSTLIPCYRRALAFPLYRSFELAECCRADVAKLLSVGKRTIVRCLLETKYILDHHEVYYVYNKIWVDDLCVWCQAYASDEVLRTIGNSLIRVKMERGLLGWGLEELEAVVRRVQERETGDSDDESDDHFVA